MSKSCSPRTRPLFKYNGDRCGENLYSGLSEVVSSFFDLVARDTDNVVPRSSIQKKKKKKEKKQKKKGGKNHRCDRSANLYSSYWLEQNTHRGELFLKNTNTVRGCSIGKTIRTADRFSIASLAIFIHRATVGSFNLKIPASNIKRREMDSQVRDKGKVQE